MIHFDRSLLLLYLQILIFVRSTEDDLILNEKLSDEERNQRCCSQHLSCCTNDKSAEPTNFEVRALLVKCPFQICNDENTREKRRIQARHKKCAKEECGGEKCPKRPNEVRNCEKKLKLTIKIRNTGVTNCKNQYIIIDHVYDPLSEKKQKLASPYVLKIKQQPILQTYGLICGGLVNYEAKEKVLNKDDEGYTGCNTNPESNPTCGAVKYNEETIPFSTGFCCSCEEGQNAKAPECNNSTENEDQPQVEISMGQVRAPCGDAEPPAGEAGAPMGQDEARLGRDVYADDSVPGFHKYNDEHYEFNSPVGRIKGKRPLKRQNRIGANDVYARSLQSANDQRLIPFSAKSGRKQKRGGQDCNDLYTPPNADPDSYHDSTHCLEFSDLWYTVYQLAEPKLYHFLQIQIYEKIRDQEGNYKWRDLTKNAPITVGTHHPHYCNEMNTIAVNYMAKEVSPHMFSLNYKVKKLLIPEITRNIDVSQFPALQGGPKEYLVVDENKVQPNGKLCDVAGVGYEAFAKQPQRCNVPKGTCLRNQPKSIWEHDHEADVSGKKGCYFLKYFGLLPENPIVVNETTQNKTLIMYYTECHTSVLDLEVKADTNQVMRSNSLAALTEVYIDSSSPWKTSLIVKVFNSGFVASVFHVKLTECPMNVPASFSNIASKPALIPPQHQHIFSLDIHCELPIVSFFCTMEVLNQKQELIAVRKIRFEKQDRCICIWHCLCACLISDSGLKCQPLSLEHYHDAGFQGGLPIPLHVVHYTFLDDMISLMLYILLFLCLTLLIMGLIKAIVGICVVAVGLWGLDMILDLPKEMNHYYESSIKHREIVYDDNGWPIHPDTGARVRNISLPAEFCLNVVFFFIYPFAVFWHIIKRLCFSSYQDNKRDSISEICECAPNNMTRKSSNYQQSPKKTSTKSTVNKGPSRDERRPKETRSKSTDKKEPSRDEQHPKVTKTKSTEIKEPSRGETHPKEIKTKSTIRDDTSTKTNSKRDHEENTTLKKDTPTKSTIRYDDTPKKSDLNQK